MESFSYSQGIIAREYMKMGHISLDWGHWSPHARPEGFSTPGTQKGLLLMAYVGHPREAAVQGQLLACQARIHQLRIQLDAEERMAKRLRRELTSLSNQRIHISETEEYDYGTSGAETSP